MMDIMHLAQMGGGPASYIPAHTSSALVNRVALRENQQSPH